MASFFQFLNFFFPLFLITLYILVIIRSHRTVKETYEKLVDLEMRAAHKTILMEVLAEGMCSPIHRLIYAKLASMTPEQALKACKNKEEFLRLITSESFVQARKELEMIMKEAPEEQKEDLQEALEELDGMFNLLSSLDKDTPKEHVRQIMDNVGASIAKLKEKGISIGLQGYNPF